MFDLSMFPILMLPIPVRSAWEVAHPAQASMPLSSCEPGAYARRVVQDARKDIQLGTADMTRGVVAGVNRDLRSMAQCQRARCRVLEHLVAETAAESSDNHCGSVANAGLRFNSRSRGCISMLRPCVGGRAEGPGAKTAMDERTVESDIAGTGMNWSKESP